MSSDSVSNSMYLGITVIILCCIVMVSVDLCVVSSSIFRIYEDKAYTGASIRTPLEELTQYDTYAPTCYRILSENESLIKVLNIYMDNYGSSTSDIDVLKKYGYKKFKTSMSKDNKGFYYVDMIEVD